MIFPFNIIWMEKISKMTLQFWARVWHLKNGQMMVKVKLIVSQWKKKKVLSQTLNNGLRLLWIIVPEKRIFSLSGSIEDPFFKTTNMTNCSGPPSTGATLIAAVSKMHSSARSHTRSISTELVCVSPNIQSFQYFRC